MLSQTCTRTLKVPEDYKQDCLKIFILFSALAMMIQVSRKSTHLAQKVDPIKKLPISEVERFLKSSFELKPPNVELLTHFSCVRCFIKDWKKTLKL